MRIDYDTMDRAELIQLSRYRIIWVLTEMGEPGLIRIVEGLPSTHFRDNRFLKNNLRETCEEAINELYWYMCESEGKFKEGTLHNLYHACKKKADTLRHFQPLTLPTLEDLEG